jgi:hypothetical protein
MTALTSPELLSSRLPIYLASSVRMGSERFRKTGFLRQKTPQGLLIACWRSKTAAEASLQRLPGATRDYQVIEADERLLKAVVDDLGESTNEVLFVLID